MLITVGIIFAAALTGLLLIGNDGVAATKTVDGVTTSDAGSVFMPVIKMFSALVVVLVSIYVGVYLLRRTMGKKFSGNRAQNALQVIETTFVAPKKSISLVRVADKSVLIGVTDQGISMLTELDSEATAALLVDEVEAEEAVSFADLLKSTARRVQDLSKRPREKLIQAES